MRQKGMSAVDVAFRAALANMRYAKCTTDDVALLRTRVLSNSGNSALTSLAGYEDVAIITARNIHRDAINADGAERFARRHGKELHYFYSKDSWGKVKDSVSIRTAQKLYEAVDDPVRSGNAISPRLQRVLWNLKPSKTEHLAGVLALCEDMPVLLKTNEATELGATNGAAGTVVGWQARSDAAGREYLQVLFVRLTNPPKTFQLEGLDENVVPIVPQKQSVLCTLPAGKLQVSIQREQVACLQNFAISDFTCQGLTRLRNVIHPRYCKNHQSLYTVLSRSSSLQDTIILEGLDSSKMQCGASPALMQEFRELELLDEITYLSERGELPVGLRGTTRGDLIAAFLQEQGAGYVPPRAEGALSWETLTHASVSTVVTDAGTAPRGTKRALQTEQWVVAERSVKARCLSPDAIEPSAPRQGLRWDNDNWSCAYDSLLTILWNVRVDRPPEFFRSLTTESTSGRVLVTRFSSLPPRGSSLECVRDAVRDLLFMCSPESFPRLGHTLTSVTDLFLALFDSPELFGVSSAICEACGTRETRATDISSSYVWTILPDLLQHIPNQRGIPCSQRVLEEMLSSGSRIRCSGCRTYCDLSTSFTQPPPLFSLDVSNTNGIRADSRLTITVQGTLFSWALTGIIYHGYDHFTCRYIALDNSVWYHDGMDTAQFCIRETQDLLAVDLLTCRGRRATHYIYTLLSQSSQNIPEQ
ncbi:hypothetical protein FKP32DRAFT_1581304 [Trametes sanguinea]|nr:hypothetical protein FKP32DRAFT_1581304 [Trametes sanguinea]